MGGITINKTRLKFLGRQQAETFLELYRINCQLEFLGCRNAHFNGISDESKPAEISA